MLPVASSLRRGKGKSRHLFSKGERTRIVWTLVAAALLLLVASLQSRSSELSPASLAAWDRYILAQSARVRQSAQGGSFLWSDESPDRVRRLREGEILIAPLGENPKVVAHALIHHWIGAIFLPNARLEDVLQVVRDYDRYKDFYAPNVIESKRLSETGTDDTFSVRMLNKAVVANFALDAHLQTSYAQVDKNRWYSVGFSTRIREIEEYGHADQYELPAGTGHGFIWRLYNVSRFEQRDGGVYVELEAAALSRDVPPTLRWLVSPVVRRVSKASMLVSLQKTQAAVLATSELATRATGNNQVIEEQSVPANKSLAPEVGNGFVQNKPFRPRHSN
ncbi:MAG: hypothetical protein ACJ746_10945 [Bryobacteraceae bacterium]